MNSWINQGKDGLTYLSAYAIAVKHGCALTETEWLASLKGEDGKNAKLRIDSASGDLQWQQDGEGAWQKLCSLSEMQSEIVAMTLYEAQSAKTDAERAKTAAQAASAAALDHAESSKQDSEKAHEAAKDADLAVEEAQALVAQASNAAQIAAQHADSALLSKSWAVGETGIRANENRDNARFWALQAQNAVSGGVLSFNGRGGVVVPQNGDYNAEQVGAVPIIRTVNGKSLSGDITLTADDVQAVPTERMINGKALSANVILTATDIGAEQAGVSSALTAHRNDVDKHISESERSAWNAKLDASRILLSQNAPDIGSISDNPEGTLLFVYEATP